MNPKIAIALIAADMTIRDLIARCEAHELRSQTYREAIDRYEALGQGNKREIQQLQDRILDLGRKNIALAAEAERAEQLEQLLAESVIRIRELEAALVVARLPAASRDNVVQLVLEAA